MDAPSNLTTFLTTTLAGQVLLDLAASYAHSLLENGRGWLTDKHLDKPAQRALNDAAQIAFAALLAEARKSYPHNREAHEEAVRAALALLLAHPSVAERLLDDALTHDRLDLPWLNAQFAASGATERLTAIHFDVERCFGAWHSALAEAVQRSAAAKPDLFPQWMVANMAAVRESNRRIEDATGRIEEKLDRLATPATLSPEPAPQLSPLHLEYLRSWFGQPWATVPWPTSSKAMTIRSACWTSMCRYVWTSASRS